VNGRQRHNRNGLREKFYAEKIQAKLAALSTSHIASRLGVSRWYAGRIRERYRPHPRHWEALAQLVGLPEPVLSTKPLVARTTKALT